MRIGYCPEPVGKLLPANLLALESYPIGTDYEADGMLRSAGRGSDMCLEKAMVDGYRLTE